LRAVPKLWQDIFMTEPNIAFWLAQVHFTFLNYIQLLIFLGTIFLLMIIAGARLRAKIRDQELLEDGILRLNYLLRCPTPGGFFFHSF
jgi:hypothetical protein